MLIGNQEVINRAKAARPGEKSVYINWEAIEELPDEYEAIVTEIKFDPKNLDRDFSNVGTSNSPSWMPNPDLMYKIAEACGISGGDNSIAQPIMEEVDINPMLCKQIDAPPIFQRRKTGERVIKFATRVQDDGTFIRSSACTIDYNVWDRCLEAWMKEEAYTDSYTKQGKYPPKYNTPAKRRLHFQSEMKFAHAKAETKAHLKAIRELAGLMTGYKTTDLQSGSLIFARVRRSKKILQAETTARLSAISHGVKPAEKPQALLFGSTEPDNTIEPDDVYSESPDVQQFKNKNKRQVFIDALSNYIDNDIVNAEMKQVAEAVLNWLKSDENAEGAANWSAAVERLKAIETNIPADIRSNHEIY
jgi:hypothetical protein